MRLPRARSRALRPNVTAWSTVTSAVASYSDTAAPPAATPVIAFRVATCVDVPTSRLPAVRRLTSSPTTTFVFTGATTVDRCIAPPKAPALARLTVSLTARNDSGATVMPPGWLRPVPETIDAASPMATSDVESTVVRLPNRLPLKATPIAPPADVIVSPSCDSMLVLREAR